MTGRARVLEQVLIGHGLELGLEFVGMGGNATFVGRLAQLVQRPPLAVGEELEQFASQIAHDPVARIAAETFFLIEEQPPSGADREIAVAILEEVQLGVAVAHPPQPEHHFGATHVCRRSEEVVDRELIPGTGLRQCTGSSSAKPKRSRQPSKRRIRSTASRSSLESPLCSL
jgi:hypothetical protein